MPDDNYFKNMAIDTFAMIIAKSDLRKLAYYINNGVSLIRLPESQRYISTIKAALYIPFVGDYLRNKLSLDPMEVLKFIRTKNAGVFDLLITEKGRKWYYQQFNDWMRLVKW